MLDIKVLLTKMLTRLNVVAVEHTIVTNMSVSSGSSNNTTKSVTKAGYYPLGVIGWRLANGSGSGGTNRGYAWTTDSTTSYDGVGDRTTTGTPSANNTGNPTTNPDITGSVGAVSGVTTGSGANMPPYIVVNRWHRTA